MLATQQDGGRGARLDAIDSSVPGALAWSAVAVLREAGDASRLGLVAVLEE